jgi:ectoine hydroxylase-related dioxygenase (phytanoyl-CoA dioxygenase family)
MLYLNDVNSKNGPFLFVKNSKTIDAKRIKEKQNESLIIKIKKLVKGYKLKNPRYLDSSINLYLKKNKLSITEVTGEAGDIIIFNSSYLHRGKNISDSIRYSLTSYIFPDTLKQEKAIDNSFRKIFIK